MIGLLILLGLFAGGFLSGYVVRDRISHRRRQRYLRRSVHGISGPTVGHA
jgi:hypothetical protein